MNSEEQERKHLITALRNCKVSTFMEFVLKIKVPFWFKFLEHDISNKEESHE